MAYTVYDNVNSEHLPFQVQYSLEATSHLNRKATLFNKIQHDAHKHQCQKQKLPAGKSV